MKKIVMSNGVKRGFSLIEVLIVIAVLMTVLIFSIVTFYALTKKTDLDASRDNIISTLSLARNKTLASEGAAQYGIYFDASPSPDRYVLFQGSSYATRNVSLDKIYNLPSIIEISNISLGGGNETVFNRLEGDANNYGSITIRSSANNETRTIYIYSSGEVSTRSESASGAGRITDSRHVHFNLGWNINIGDTLKFNFIDAGVIKQVPMTEYFTSVSFDWEDEFTVENIPQKFRIHTHQLTPTILCIHRDRSQGKNTQEVYIYIVQSSIEKEIAHYLADADDTVATGSYVWGDKTPQ